MKIILLAIIIFFPLFPQEFREYIIIPRDFLNLKERAKVNSNTLQTAIEGQRFFVKNKFPNWFEIELRDSNKAYVERNKVTLRELREEKALLEINKLNAFISKNLALGKDIVKLNAYAFDQRIDKSNIGRDSKGNRVLHGIRAYSNKELKGAWLYLADRQILTIEDNNRKNNWIKISIANDEEKLYVPRKDFVFSRFPRINKEIDKFILIDNLNQNMLVYERKGNNWDLLKTSLISTGFDNGRNSFKTPNGVFLVSNLKDNMLYKNRDKNNNVKKGQAPYAVRFSGGNYIHGIPVEEDINERREMIVRKWREELLGSYPLSQGCVRNKDEVAKYIYNWIRHRRNNDNYIYPLEAVAVIVFE